jgi:protein-tyrosine phosphatase
MAARPAPLRVLFVCSGNICRSPLAEALFRHLAREAGQEDDFVVDSAGMHDYHEGERADPRTRRVGRRHGIDVTSIARPVTVADFDRFDLVVALDRGHRRQLLALAPPGRAEKVRLLREFDPQADGPDVPDPYYGDEQGFEDVHAIVEAACRGLLLSFRR